MKKTDKQRIKLPLGSTSFYSGNYFHSQLDSLNRLFVSLSYEEDKEALISLYHLYIVALCSFIETEVKWTTRVYLTRTQNEVKGQHRILLNFAENRLSGSSWDRLNQDLSTYLEEPLPQSIQNSKSKTAVSKLFELRNSIMHGNAFTIAHFQDLDNPEIITSNIEGRGKSVYDYLIQEKLLTDDSIRDLNYFELNPSVVHHFIDHTYTYITGLLEFISNKLDYDLLEDHRIHFARRKHDCLLK